MSRRYIALSEAEFALRRGKSVEVFLGACRKEGTEGIRYIVISQNGDDIIARRYDCEIPHHAEFYDIYDFSPMNEELDDGDPDEEIVFASFEECAVHLEKHFPDSTKKLVNEGVAEAEYYDFRKQSSGCTTLISPINSRS